MNLKRRFSKGIMMNSANGDNAFFMFNYLKSFTLMNHYKVIEFIIFFFF